jgi:hypothetical protein
MGSIWIVFVAVALFVLFMPPEWTQRKRTR